jgi:hypothetical protein
MNLTKNCKPRQSVFDRVRRDVVLNLGDILGGRLDEAAGVHFFEENFVTSGMELLVKKSFDRLLGRRDQAATFLLSQAMGGGKTHSMIALGLLARYPSLRSKIGPGFSLGTAPIRVIGFDGRESDYPFGLWGYLADSLGKRELFADHYSPPQAPGVTSWINLLKGEPTLILLDELPPYLNDARSKAVGASSNLAEVTTTALSNLLVAVNKEELANVVVVISDLSATAYSDGAASLNTALDNLSQETQRSALRIEPVTTQGDEIYSILRTRLFESLPDIAVRDKVAVAYADAVKQARQMELTSETPESFAAQLRDSYPFHFSLRDLYGRFKANPGFQQTRGLLRLMRSVVAKIYESGQADTISLVHPYDIDLNDPDIFSEFSAINPSLTEAVREDIANRGSSHAEELDRKLGGTMAQEAAKLIYVSSLSTAQSAIHGLRDSETIAWLCAPGRDVARLRTDVLEQLPNVAWYLHLSNDGRLYFKNVQNLAAKLHGMVGSYNRETKVKELSRYLEGVFKSSVGDVYQECAVLPSWEDVRPQVDRTVLVVTDPYAGARADAPLHPDWIKFFENLEYKNRILFITGDRDTMDEVLKNAAYFKAIISILGEQEAEKLSERDPQRTEAKTSESKIRLALRSAVQQTFSQVVYPSTGGLRTEHIRLNFDNNAYEAEAQIRTALADVQKFSADPNLETWAEKMRSRLFDNQNPVVWNEVRARAATKASWQMHHPRLFEDVRANALRNGQWREEGSSIRVGPFPAAPTSVVVREKSRDDDSGAVVLEIKPVGGTKVLYEIGDSKPGMASEPVPDYNAFETKEIALSFLCIDEGPSQAPIGEPKLWHNRITLRSRQFQQGGDQFIELIAAPNADIGYTTDGSDPRTRGAKYEGPFPMPRGTHLVQAVARKGGVESDLLRREITENAGKTIDPSKPLRWKTNRHFQNRPTSEAWQLVSRLEEHKGHASNIEVYCNAPGTGEDLQYSAPENLPKSGAELRAVLERITAFFAEYNLTLSILWISFDRGQDFLDWQNRDKVAVDIEKEVSQ